jgi:opacity protein-like surface antigen
MKAPGILALALVLMYPPAASADWFITPFIGLKFAGDTNLVDLESGASNTKLTLGAIASWMNAGVLGFEAEVGYSPRFFERSSGALVARSHVITMMGNVVLSVPQEITGDSLRPFVSGGAGWMRIGIDDVVGLLPVKSNLFGINVGGGATGRLTDVSSLRFELRYFKSITNDEEEAVREGTSLSFWRAGVGLTLRY